MVDKARCFVVFKESISSVNKFKNGFNSSIPQISSILAMRLTIIKFSKRFIRCKICSIKFISLTNHQVYKFWISEDKTWQLQKQNSFLHQLTILKNKQLYKKDKFRVLNFSHKSQNLENRSVNVLKD